MKAKLSVLLVVLLACCVGLVAKVTLGDQVRQPPEPNMLVGTWIGFEDGCVYFYRLNLRTKGKGSLISLFNYEPAGVYAVDDWRLSDGQLSLSLVPKAANAEPMTLTSTYIDALKM